MSVPLLIPCMNSPNNITLESGDLRTAIIGMGANEPSNLGTPIENLKAATVLLEDLGVKPPLVSSFYQTEAIDCAPGTPDFINAVMAIELPKSLAPDVFLEQLQTLEKHFGRRKQAVINGPRPLDLDLLYFGLLKTKSPHLEIPHPRVTERRFVIEPLAEIAPDLVLPGESVSAQELLQGLPKEPRVIRL